MKFSQLVLIVLLTIATTWATTFLLAPPLKQVASSVEKNLNAYDRVLHSGTLRCGYQYWDGAIMRDEKTNRMHGVWVDLTEALGKATGLKIEWTAQVSWDDVGAALKSSKIDAMCAGMWTSAAKAKEINFSTPLAYQAIEAFVRSDDHRFDTNLNLLNNPLVKLAVIENDNSDFIAQQDYSNAQRVSLGQMNGTDGDLLMYVMTNKSDATFTVTGLWRQFDKNNPGKVRRLSPDTKLRVFGLSYAVDNDDPRLLNLLNAGVQEIENSGMLDKILDKGNADYPDMFIKPIKAFP